MELFANPIPIGDEEVINFNVPSFVWSDVRPDRVVSTYIMRWWHRSRRQFQPPGIPNQPPNNVLAPFWTDLDGTLARHL